MKNRIGFRACPSNGFRTDGIGNGDQLKASSDILGKGGGVLKQIVEFFQAAIHEDHIRHIRRNGGRALQRHANVGAGEGRGIVNAVPIGILSGK